MKEPTLEEYGLTASSYEGYRNQKNDLEKELSEYISFLDNSFNDFKKKIESSMPYSLFNFLLGWSITLGLISLWIRWDYFWIFIIFFILVFILSLYFDDDKVIEPKKIELGIKKEIKNKDINEKIQLIKNKVYPFEEACAKYYEEFLEKYFKENLYKKHSGSEKFEESLTEFSVMVAQVKDEIKDINEKIVFRYIHPYYYESYLEGRKINHNFQKEKKQLFHSFNKVTLKKKENLEQKNVAEELVSDPNKEIKEEFRKKVELERVEKEKIRLIPPEKKFRIARKIDNWEEINKKRKDTGDKGEEIVFLLEKDYLKSINREDLSSMVKHTSIEKGDGAGYDILSFTADGKEKYIEVKSTTGPIKTSFNISKNEFEFLKEHNEDAFIYRVSLNTEPPEVMVKSSLEILESEIIPTSYVVKLE
jgi:hypothetical protein